MFRDPSEEADEVPKKRSRPQRILSVTGAKGGAGKSMLAANLAVYLASIGRRVMVQQKKLPELARRVRVLERELAELNRKIGESDD